MSSRLRLGLFSSSKQRRLVRGLTQRVRECQSQSSRTSVELEQQAQEMEAEFHQSRLDLERQHRERTIDSITEWDHGLDEEWVKMERGTLLSLQNETRYTEQLLAKQRATRDQTLKAHKLRREALSKEFENNKLQPGRRLEQKKSQLQTQLQELEGIREAAEQLIRQRSVSVPFIESKGEPSSGDSEITSVEEATSRLKVQKQVIDDAFHAMRHNTPAQLTESLRVWLIGAGVGLLIGAILYFLNLGGVVAVAAGLGGAVLASLGILLAVRPALARITQQHYPNIKSAILRSQQIVQQATKAFEQQALQEQQHIKQDYQSRLTHLEAENETAINKIQTELESESTRIKQIERASRHQFAIFHRERLQSLDQSWAPKLETIGKSQGEAKYTMLQDHRARLDELKQQKRNGLTFYRSRLASGVQWVDQEIGKLNDRFRDLFPSWQNASAWSATRLKRANDAAILPLGTLTLSIGPDAFVEQESVRISPLLARMPIIFQMVDQGSLAIEASPGAWKQAQSTLRNLILRAFSSLPAGGLQTTIIDPDGLGRDFAWLMHLADTDPKMVNYRVWTQSSHISEQLGRLSHHTEDVIQQLLRDRYHDIRDYNREAASMAEPFRLVVWSRFPTGLDENSWKYLTSLVSAGGRCGVSVVLLVDPTLPWPSFADPKRLEEIGLRIRMEQAGESAPVATSVVEPTLASFPLVLENPPEPELQSLLLEKCAQEALTASRVEVPFATIVPQDSAATSSSADGLAIPIGQSGVGRIQSMRLGAGTAQHVLIAGKTGSGKSSLLHTMVTAAAIKYAPDQLRLVLLDFKKGVEFQVYAESTLPHADIIGIESQREFGLSTLEYLDRVMQKRGELFRQSGVQDVPNWVARHPDRPMPRILVVIDEFQELFTEDDKLAQQASMLLDRIVRQGRSFGMHVVLASQTLGGAYSLPRTTLAQMAVRIALQCEGSDAMIILGEDNLAAERLRLAGQGIYNDASGRVEGNQPFQVAYLPKSIQRERLAAVPAAATFVDPSNNSLGRCVVFEGHRPATWDASSIEQSLQSVVARDSTAMAVVLGDSVSIEPAVAVQLSRQAGRNVLLVGTEDRNAAACLGTILATATKSSRQRLGQPLGIYCLDGTRPDDEYSAKLPPLVRLLDPHAVVSDVRASAETVGQLHQEMKTRLGQTEKSFAPIMQLVLQLGRFRDLRKNDDFGFGSEEETIKPDVQFQELLRDGPTVGIHTLLWSDNSNTLGRWLARQSMHDLELRILMQMSSNDSNHLIDSAIANRLDANVLLVHDEATGQNRKFRPYQISQPTSIADWANS